jgi:hypothetical protein
MYGLKPVPFSPYPSARTLQPVPIKLTHYFKMAHRAALVKIE